MRAALVAFGLLVVGCGASATDAARATLSTSARVVASIDAANADAMHSTRDADMAAATSREDALRRRAPYWRVQESIDGARGLLYAAEATLDAGGHDAFVPVAQCVVEALYRLRESVDVLQQASHVSVPIPPELDLLVHALRRYGGTCRVPEGGAR